MGRLIESSLMEGYLHCGIEGGWEEGWTSGWNKLMDREELLWVDSWKDRWTNG